jgi:hypothetical protein
MIVLLLNQKCGVGRTARVAFCRCAAMPKPTLTVIDADRKALRGTGPSSARMLGYRAASPTRTHGRFMPATMQLTSNSRPTYPPHGPTTSIPPARRGRIKGALLGMGSLPPARRTTLHKRAQNCDVGGEHE